MTTQPSFFIGSIPIYGDLVLAPMDGISDSPFRKLARKLGSSMSYTEFINARDVIFGSPYLHQRISFDDSERPIAFQIFDDDPDNLVKAARILLKYDPDIIDINLGCSARSVVGRGAGAALLKTPQKIAQILSQLKKILEIPFTAKIRLGWDDENKNYMEIAQIIQDSGAKLIAVHARTKQQNYSGVADWNAISQIKEKITIPVIGNGDIINKQDIYEMKTQTKCDGIMIGRGAITNPWIFSKKDREEITPYETYWTLVSHLEEMRRFYGDDRAQFLFRKFFVGYIKPYHLPRSIRLKLLTMASPDEFIRTTEKVFLDYLPEHGGVL